MSWAPATLAVLAFKVIESAVLAKVGKDRDELLRELLVGQCDVVLVYRDGLPHRLVQVVQVDAEDHHGRLEQHRTDLQVPQEDSTP